MPRIPVNFSNIHIDRFIRRAQPGATDAIFPRFMEENAIFQFPLFPVGLQWRFGATRVQSFTAGVGVSTISDQLVGVTALRYYHAISLNHNDPTSRRSSISIRDDATGAIVGIGTLVLAQGVDLVVDRPIVIGERHQIRAEVVGIGAGNALTLRTYSIEQGLGADLPGL